jgi:hypothetical protein
MKRGVRTLATAAAALFITPFAALPQNYTISAKPGVVNYIEGTAYLNGNKLSEQATRATFLSAGDRLSTDAGKAEVLLTPGVFLRIGDNSEIHMIAPSLTDTQVEVVRGEAIIEAAGLMKDNRVQVTDHGASISIERNGLYRFKADDPPAAAVLEGKAEVYFGDKKVELGKNHEAVLSAALKSEKFNPKQEDELYAWSNVRSEYDAAASYQSAQTAAASNYGGGWGNYGFGGLYGPGWFWNSAFDSYAWLPGYGAFYSPFGWGFYSPGAVGYAPVVTGPVYRGGHWDHHGQPGNGDHHGRPGNPNWTGHHWTGTSTNAAVPVRTDRPPAVGVVASSPWAAHEARVQAARSLSSIGAFTPGAARGSAFAAGSHISGPGAVAVRGGGGWSGGGAAGHAGGWSGGHAGGWSGGHAGGSAGAAGHAGGSAGAAGHAGGGGWSGGGGHAGGGGFSGGGGGGGHAGGGGGGGGGHH